MRFGWNCSYRQGPDDDMQAYVRLAQAMEATGFSTFWYGDHVFMPQHFDASAYPYMSFPADNAWPDIFSLLAAAAVVTRTIRLGPSVAIIPYRPPILLAQAVATVDALSNGRLYLGAGVGWMREEFEALGIPFTERGARATDTMRIIRPLLQGQQPDFESRFFTVPKGHLQPMPVQKPHPPIIVGGEGLPAWKRIAAYGDGWQFYFQPIPQLQETLAGLKEQMDLVGRSMAELDLQMACDHRHFLAHRDEIADYEALGIRELVIRPEYETVGEALAKIEGLAAELIR